MAENVMEHIVAELRRTTPSYFPHHADLRNVRVVGHTPKSDHYVYDIVIDFADGTERAYAKLYRQQKGAMSAAKMASIETSNLITIYRLAEQKKLDGVPRPMGDFSAMGAVVAEKLVGIPLQSIIMKAALLPGYADHVVLRNAAKKTGEWLKKFHNSTSDQPAMINSQQLVKELEKLCVSCKDEGLDDASIEKIVSGAHQIISRTRSALPQSAVLNDFSPLNVTVGENGIGFSDFARMSGKGSSLHDAAQFLACIEALEKYPFCNRSITAEVQEQFLNSYGISEMESDILRVLKMKSLLSMFARGRNVKESAVRKKVMWANVMKRFIQQAADRSLPTAA